MPVTDYLAEALSLFLVRNTVASVARESGIPANHLYEMRDGRRRITPLNDLRLCRFFGKEQGYFLLLQMKTDMEGVAHR